MPGFFKKNKTMTSRNNKIICCTYFDKNYLLKGLSMHSSLIEHNPDMQLWILCMDDYTENILRKLNIKNVVIIPLCAFEDKELLKAKSNRSLVEYYWTCTPSLPLYIFNKSAYIERVIYLDADLFFYSSLQPALKELGNQSIYTVEHRYPPGQESRIETSGRFNVGFQIYNRDNKTFECLKRWRKQCLEWCYWRVENGKLGDQLYLDEWPRLYKDLVISKNLGVNAAPWNIKQYNVCKRDDKVYINGDQLMCYHFHQFIIMGMNSFEQVGYCLPKKIVEYIYRPYEIEITEQIQAVKNFDREFEVVYPKRKFTEMIKLLLIKLLLPYYWHLKTLMK